MKVLAANAAEAAAQAATAAQAAAEQAAAEQAAGGAQEGRCCIMLEDENCPILRAILEDWAAIAPPFQAVRRE